MLLMNQRAFNDYAMTRLEGVQSQTAGQPIPQVVRLCIAGAMVIANEAVGTTEENQVTLIQGWVAEWYIFMEAGRAVIYPEIVDFERAEWETPACYARLRGIE